MFMSKVEIINFKLVEDKNIMIWERKHIDEGNVSMFIYILLYDATRLIKSMIEKKLISIKLELIISTNLNINIEHGS